MEENLQNKISGRKIVKLIVKSSQMCRIDFNKTATNNDIIVM